MARIFISYRRDDSAYVASMVRESLEDAFGPGTVFMDVDNIPLGVDFRTTLADAVSTCDVLVALIGERWIGDRGPGEKRRLDDAQDFVRIEIEAALARGIPVVPVLVDKAQLPQACELPESLKDLQFRNATEVRPGRNLQQHLSALVSGLRLHVKVEPKDGASTSSSTGEAQPKRPAAAVASPPPSRRSDEPSTPPRAGRWPVIVVGLVVAAVVIAFLFLSREPKPPVQTAPLQASPAVDAAVASTPAPRPERQPVPPAAPAVIPTAKSEAAPLADAKEKDAAIPPAAMNLNALSGYTVGIYFPEADNAARATATSIQRELAALGHRGIVRLYPSKSGFLESVVPATALEVRYESGVEDEPAAALRDALLMGRGKRNAQLVEVGAPTANFISIFVPEGG